MSRRRSSRVSRRRDACAGEDVPPPLLQLPAARLALVDPPCTGCVGRLPVSAWIRTVSLLCVPLDVDPEEGPDHCCAELFQLRRVSRSMCSLVAKYASGGIGWIKAHPRLLEAPVTSFGRALQICFGDPAVDQDPILREMIARRHSISFECFPRDLVGLHDSLEAWPAPSTLRLLAAASAKGLLVDVYVFAASPQSSFSGLSSINAGCELNLAEIAAAGDLRCLTARGLDDHDVAALSGLAQLTVESRWLTDITPLARIPKLSLIRCAVERIPPHMHNEWLEFRSCTSLRNIDGLASSRVRTIVFDFVPVTSVAPIAAMRPLPRKVVLVGLEALTSVAPLGRRPCVDSIVLSRCPKLLRGKGKRAATAASLAKVASVRLGP